MKVLVLGASGMLGSAVYRYFCQRGDHEVCGTLRSTNDVQFFPERTRAGLISGIDVLDTTVLMKTLAKIKPDIIINCVGLIKQHAESNDPLICLPLNSLFPHQLAVISSLMGSRLVLVSTDCVFSGRRGAYLETDISDAEDLYGKSKYMGEVHNKTNVITLRTSIIGHELHSSHSLIDWFLSQNGVVKGYSQAVFSGLPTNEMARVIHDYVIPNRDLAGLYNVSVDPISKLDLLRFVMNVYRKDIKIIPDSMVKIDRSLNSELFRKATGYVPPSWQKLVEDMHQFRMQWKV